MCFKVDIIKNPKPLVAEKHLICYKLLRRRKNILTGKTELLSPIMNFLYERNKVYKSELKKSTFPKVIIEEGLHSFSHYGCAFIQRSLTPFHVEMAYIPKGSIYYKNEFEYVSNQLVIGNIPNVSLWSRLVDWVRVSILNKNLKNKYE